MSCSCAETEKKTDRKTDALFKINRVEDMCNCLNNNNNNKNKNKYFILFYFYFIILKETDALQWSKMICICIYIYIYNITVFYCTFDQTNAVLVSRRDFRNQKLMNGIYILNIEWGCVEWSYNVNIV